MKVNQLIEALSKVDPELDVLCYTEDEELLPKRHMFRLLEIDSVDVSESGRRRGYGQVPTLKLGKGPHSVNLALINVTSDF